MRNALFWIGVAILPLSASQDFIDKAAEMTLEEWGIPGLSLAIVHHGTAIKTQGYGTKVRGKENPVDAKTTFQIASLTKAFTGLTAALLVEEGLLDWDTPVRVYAPDLCFKDPIANREMTLTDLLSQRTGLPGTCNGEDDEWYKKDCTTEDLMRRLATIDPFFPFRSHFSYSNLSYVAVSHIIGRVISSPWDLFCKERIFDPLEMTRTYFSYELFLLDLNRADPHLPQFKQVEPIAPLNWNSLKAAGGINSCAEDVAKWMNYCLCNIGTRSPIFTGHTRVDGRELMGDEDFDSLWPIYSHGQEIVHYGFGWMMYPLAGRTVFFHVGLSCGMSSVLALVPEEELGIAILTNQSYHLGDIRFLNQLLDYYLQR